MEIGWLLVIIFAIVGFSIMFFGLYIKNGLFALGGFLLVVVALIIAMITAMVPAGDLQKDVK